MRMLTLLVLGAAAATMAATSAAAAAKPSPLAGLTPTATLNAVLACVKRAYETDDEHACDALIASDVVTHTPNDDHSITELRGAAAFRKQLATVAPTVDFIAWSNVVGTRNDGGNVIIGTGTSHMMTASSLADTPGCLMIGTEGWRVELNAEQRVARIDVVTDPARAFRQCATKGVDYTRVAAGSMHDTVRMFLQRLSDMYALVGDDERVTGMLDVFAADARVAVPGPDGKVVPVSGVEGMEAALRAWKKGVARLTFSNLVVARIGESSAAVTVTLSGKYRTPAQSAVVVQEGWFFTFTDAGLIATAEATHTNAELVPSGQEFAAAAAAAAGGKAEL